MAGSFTKSKELSAKMISVLEKGLGFVPTPSHINEADLQRDLRSFLEK